MSEHPTPESEYRARLGARRAVAGALVSQERRLASARVVVFVVGLAVAYLAYRGDLPALAVTAPMFGFLALLVVHDRAIQRRERAERAARFYEEGLARLEDRWSGQGNAGEGFRSPEHPYTEDLDIFGKGSLFELLCQARTRNGEVCLADWLRAPASAAEVRARQEAVAELRDRLDLREDLAMLGERVRAESDPAALAAWGVSPVRLTSRPMRAIALVLGVLTAASGLAWVAGWNPVPFTVLAILSQAFNAPLAGAVADVMREMDRHGRELELLAQLLTRVERESFAGEKLSSLRAVLVADGVLPSTRLRRIQKLESYLQIVRNGIFGLAALLVLWPTSVAFAVEEWRAENGSRLGPWLGAIGEFEALCSLAGYAYENPAARFPEVLPEATAGSEAGPLVEADSLAHPLLPRSRVVANDVRLGLPERLLVVSGSNMSGKSTYMRTIGTNVVLALAGAPVRAQRMRLTPVSIGASLRIQDSLQEGISRFYAEITRLRQVVDLAHGQPPLLFLLDEILGGTNSHDRTIGASAVLRSLVERGAIGLATTHDLALTCVADELAPLAANVHFEDHLEGDRMVFDYQLRPGVVQKSNALALMRAVGLDV